MSGPTPLRRCVRHQIRRTSMWVSWDHPHDLLIDYLQFYLHAYALDCVTGMLFHPHRTDSLVDSSDKQMVQLLSYSNTREGTSHERLFKQRHHLRFVLITNLLCSDLFNPLPAAASATLGSSVSQVSRSGTGK